LTQVARHLIISSDTITWKFDRPVLFLGKWCLRQQDRNIWENMDAVIAEPIGTESQDRHLLHLAARRIESELFYRLVPILNDHHGISRDERYWKIILGHWLREVVQLLLNRIVTFERCLNEHQISSVTLYTSPNFVLAAKNYGDIWSQSMDNSWNAHLYAKIVELFQVRDIDIESLKIELQQNEELNQPKNVIKKTLKARNGLKLNVRRLVDKSARQLAAVQGREKDAFIINSYLPPEKELLLNLALGQFPQRRITLDFAVTTEVDNNIRSILSKKMNHSKDAKIEGIIASLLFDLIPINYLEGYKKLLETSELVRWPKKPRFIFTSNNFVADEIFKVWAAEKVNKGVPYIVGQHGNGYGTHKFLENTIEEVTSDRFLTWGWNRGLPQHVPAFIFKNALSSSNQTSQSTRLLLVECNPTVRFVVWDQADEFEEYMSDQFTFVSTLDNLAKENLLVRLHPAFAIMQSEGDLRWFNFDRNIRLDLGTIPIRKLWAKSKLIVHSYDSTGLLETLEANRPTIAFWQNGLDHLVEEAIPYYELLISAGIVHLTPESAAAKINEIWGDVDSWWKSHGVQNTREIFCHEYARASNKPIRELKRLLLETKEKLA
jgi:putative transferase (TIGR04331 family)